MVYLDVTDAQGWGPIERDEYDEEQLDWGREFSCAYSIVKEELFRLPQNGQFVLVTTRRTTFSSDFDDAQLGAHGAGAGFTSERPPIARRVAVEDAAHWLLANNERIPEDLLAYVADATFDTQSPTSDGANTPDAMTRHEIRTWADKNMKGDELRLVKMLLDKGAMPLGDVMVEFGWSKDGQDSRLMDSLQTRVNKKILRFKHRVGREKGAVKFMALERQTKK